MGGPAWERCPASPTEGRSSVSTEQKETLDAILRQSAFPADTGVSELRRLLAEQASAQPRPAGVTVTAAALGGIPTAEITIDGIDPRHVVLPTGPRHGHLGGLPAIRKASGPRVQIPPPLPGSI